MLGIAPSNEQRQAESFLGSLFSSGGWILPATGVAVAGIYREEISDIIEEIVGEYILFWYTSNLIKMLLHLFHLMNS